MQRVPYSLFLNAELFIVPIRSNPVSFGASHFSKRGFLDKFG